jgi:hypothetical protein
MADHFDPNAMRLIVNLIDDSIVANSHSIPQVCPDHLFAAPRARVVPKCVDRFGDSAADGLFEVRQITPSGGV